MDFLKKLSLFSMGTGLLSATPVHSAPSACLLNVIAPHPFFTGMCAAETVFSEDPQEMIVTFALMGVLLMTYGILNRCCFGRDY